MWALALIGVAAAVAVGVSAIATAYAQRDIGSAAVGAMAENEKLFGKGLIMTAIPETTVVFGFAIAFLLIGKLSDPVTTNTLVRGAAVTSSSEKGSATATLKDAAEVNKLNTASEGH